MHLIKHAPTLVGGLLALALSAATFAADDPAAAKHFRAATTAWAAAYNAGNIDAIVGMYADGAVVMPPDAPAVTGEAALRDYLAKDIASAKAGGVTLSIADGDAAGTSGNLGWHSGPFRMLGADGRTVATGKYMEVWAREGGAWRIVRDIWNMDAPRADAPPAPPPAN